MTAGPESKLERDGHPTAVLATHEAAAYLALTTGTLYTMVRAGELPHTRVGRSIRFRLVDLDEYLAGRTTRTWERVDGRGRPGTGRNG